MKKVYIINEQVEYNPEKHTLTSLTEHAEVILLNTPASRCLHLLLNKRGHVVEQREFFYEVWEKFDTEATQNTLYQNISLLRRGLKFAGIENELIVTVPRKGMTLADDIVIETQDYVDDVTEETSTYRDNSIRKTDKSRASKSYRLVKWYAIAIILMSMFMVMIASIFFFIYPKQRDYFTNYVPLADVQNCHFFAHIDGQSTISYNDFIKNTTLDCSTKQYLYMRAYKSYLGIALLRCEAPLQSTNMTNSDCYSEIYFEKKNEE